MQTKASEIGATLTGAAQEYNLTVSSAVLTPWQDGASAVSDYQTAFDTATSSTTDKLTAIKNGWQGIINKMIEASKINVSNIHAENTKYAATVEETPPAPTPTPTPEPEPTPAPSAPSLAYGSSVTIKSTATHFGSNSGGAAMASFVPGGTYTVYQTSGDQVLIGRNGVYTGWVNKSDIQGFAKGTISANKDQIAWVDELGEELQFVPGNNGRLEFVKKGTGIVPADLTQRIIDLAMNPQEVLDRNRPTITPSKSVVNNEMQLSVDASVGTLIHVEHLDGNNPDEVVKLVNKTWDKKMQGLNNAIKKFTR